MRSPMMRLALDFFEDLFSRHTRLGILEDHLLQFLDVVLALWRFALPDGDHATDHFDDSLQYQEKRGQRNDCP